MGILTPHCVATDGTSLYALTRTKKYGEAGTNYHVLIKSNPSPASIRDVSWTLVSAVSRSANYYLSGQYACAVNDKGVFTVVSDKAQVSETFTGTLGFKGLQFVPTGSSGVEGSWHNVDTEGLFYSWPYTDSGLMFHYKDATGTSTPMVAYINPSNKAPFVAAMSPAGNTLLGGTIGWEMPVATFGNPASIVGLDNKLFIYNSNYRVNNTLNVITLSSPNTNLTSAPPIQGVNATMIETICSAAYSTIQMYTLNSNVILMCKNSDYNDNHIFTFDGNTIVHLPAVKGMYSFSPDSFVPIGSTSPFIFMHDSSGVYSVALSGPTASTFSPGNFYVNISDPYGTEPTSSGTSGSRPTSTSSPSGKSSEASNTAMRVGVGLGAFVVVATLLCMWYRRRRRVVIEHVPVPQTQQYRQPVTEIPVMKQIPAPPLPPPAHHVHQSHAAPILISTQPPPTHHGHTYTSSIMKPTPPLPPYAGHHIYGSSQPNPNQGSRPWRSPHTTAFSRSPHTTLPTRSPQEK